MRATVEALATQARGGPLTTRLGSVVEATDEAFLLVEFDGNVAGPLAARCIAGLWSNGALQPGDLVVLAFENGDPSRPIALGTLAPASKGDMQVVQLRHSGERPKLGVVDGERVMFDARKEIVLQCGMASITLRADGKIILKGREIISRALEANKIKGSTVNIN